MLADLSTALPAPAVPRWPVIGLCRVALMLCLFMVGRWFFAAAMWCAHVGGGLETKR